METKICFKCKESKKLELFCKNKLKKDGIDIYCKKCSKIMRDITTSKEKDNILTKICNVCNFEKSINDFIKNKNSFRPACKICRNKKESERRKNNPESVTKANKKYWLNNKDKSKLRSKLYREKRISEDLNYKLKLNVSSLIKISFNSFSKGNKSIKILGCSIEEFRQYIESQFLPWMNWDNYGNVCETLEYNCSWDLDHIIPVSKAKTEEELYLLNHWSNFQPLCSKVNRNFKKSNVYPVTNLELNITILKNKIENTCNL